MYRYKIQIMAHTQWSDSWLVHLAPVQQYNFTCHQTSQYHHTSQPTPHFSPSSFSHTPTPLLLSHSPLLPLILLSHSPLLPLLLLSHSPLLPPYPPLTLPTSPPLSSSHTPHFSPLLLLSHSPLLPPPPSLTLPPPPPLTLSILLPLPLSHSSLNYVVVGGTGRRKEPRQPTTNHMN